MWDGLPILISLNEYGSGNVYNSNIQKYIIITIHSVQDYRIVSQSFEN